ncbi:hypothetical protein Pla108_22450 [Botrimarina colliarenosi]|uniref:Fimbrial assembly protein (PilN) n=1 Tax=Botrimarina colliarenosi TaxID=2528001 RepID=A0A5C6AFK1_9BACT|nr:hypothetical protein [Botrimarina colliarenosi]TWT98088.1 hypothetical protein Pla108_22450 [Botrimarina colliarenosi]
MSPTETRSINLLPFATKRAQAARRVTRVWMRAVLASSCCAAALLGVEWLRGVAALQELQELNARNAPFELIAQEKASVSSQLHRLRQREQITLRLARDEQGLAVLGVLAKAAAQSSGAVYLDEFFYQNPIDSLNQSAMATTSVRLQGASIDGLSVAAFATALRDSGLFAEVGVENTEPLAGGSASMRRFTLAGSF